MEIVRVLAIPVLGNSMPFSQVGSNLRFGLLHFGLILHVRDDRHPGLLRKEITDREADRKNDPFVRSRTNPILDSDCFQFGYYADHLAWLTINPDRLTNRIVALK